MPRPSGPLFLGRLCPLGTVPKVCSSGFIGTFRSSLPHGLTICLHDDVILTVLFSIFFKKWNPSMDLVFFAVATLGLYLHWAVHQHPNNSLLNPLAFVWTFDFVAQRALLYTSSHWGAPAILLSICPVWKDPSGVLHNPFWPLSLEMLTVIHKYGQLAAYPWTQLSFEQYVHSVDRSGK